MELIDIIKPILDRQTDFYSFVGIRKKSDNLYDIDYVSIEQYQNNSPYFKFSTLCNIDLKVELRDMKIHNLLKSEPVSEFNVEELIYTEDQRERLRKLRDTTPISSRYGWDLVNKAKKEYSENFKVGQKIYYNNLPGFITFKHESKGNIPQRWSVKVQNIEYRRVYGHELLARKVEDLSNIKIDKDLDRLSTDKLLKMYRRKLKLNRGIGDKTIKRILQDREHVQKGQNKIIEVR